MNRRTGASAAAGLFVQLWLLTSGDWSVFARRRSADFFDAQADAWLHGHWWIPRRVAGIEGIVVDGHTQVYFGPFPALLRLPVAVFGGAPGRLTVVSMLVAAAVSVWASLRLVRQVAEPPAWAAAAVAFVVPAGTTLTFLASRPIVYHEAGAWGVATALVALTLLVDAANDPRRRTLVLAVVAATACALARASVALGPVVGLGLLALVRGWRARRPTAALAAPVVPVVVMASVNFVRFGTLLSVPFQQQVQSALDPDRPAFFAANGGSFFNVRFLPTTLFHYLNPLGLRPSGWFPFVEFPPPGRVIGHATFDLVDRTASVPATMPALVVLALFGAVALGRRRGDLGLRLAAAGGVAAALPILVFGYVAHRYLADVVPGLVVLAACGLPIVLARRWLTATIAVLLVAGLWANVGLGLVHQRLWGPLIEEADAHAFVAQRLSVNELLGLADPAVRRVGELPDRAGTGELVVVGDCEAVYLETGVAGILPMGHWRSIERAGLTQRVRLTATVGVVADVDGGRLLAERQSDRVRLVWAGPQGRVVGAAVDADAVLTVTVDPHVDELVVRVGERRVLGFVYLGNGDVRLREARRVGGEEPTVCRQLLDQAGRVG